MPTALFVSQTAEKGGAELFLVDVIKAGQGDWNGCFLNGDGPAVADLRRSGFAPVVLHAGARLLGVKRQSSFLALPMAVVDLIRIAVKLAGVAERYDVLCANSQKALFVCALATLIARKPLIWLLHDIVTNAGFSPTTRLAAITFSRLFARIVVVNSKATGEGFVASGGNPAKIRLVYNGFDIKAWQSPSGVSISLREELGLDPRPIIGVFSRLSEWKGQHVLLEAMLQCPDIQVIIVGAALFGEDAYAQKLHAMVEDNHLRDRVRFLSFRSDVGSLMRSVDIVAHTSIAAEPFGRVIVEGMLSGKPVIATKAGGVTEIIRHGETGLLVAPGDVAGLSEAIVRLVADPGLAGRLAEAGAREAAARFSLEGTRDALQSVIGEAVGGAPLRELKDVANRS